jgi:hypothetical protein
MASQPANTLISVFRNVRTYRQDLRHESVKNITDRLRPLVFSVPGEETLTVFGVRDTTYSDMSPYMGEGRPTATRGVPVTIGVRAAKDFNTIETITGVNIPFTIGSDKFVENTAANLGRDLHQDLRDA